MTQSPTRGRPRKPAPPYRSLFAWFDPAPTPKPAHRPSGASKLNAYDNRVVALAIGLLVNDPRLRPYTAARHALELYGARAHGAAANHEARRIERKLRASGIAADLPRMRRLTPPGTLDFSAEFMCKARFGAPC